MPFSQPLMNGTAIGPRGFGDWEMEAVLLPLANDLADVWLDVKHGLVALDAGARETDVIWEWRFGFYWH